MEGLPPPLLFKWCNKPKIREKSGKSPGNLFIGVISPTLSSLMFVAVIKSRRSRIRQLTNFSFRFCNVYLRSLKFTPESILSFYFVSQLRLTSLSWPGCLACPVIVIDIILLVMLARGVWKLRYSSFTSSPLKGILRSTWMKLRTMLDPLILSCLFALIQTYAICLGSMSGNSLSDICLVLVARRALGRKKEARPPACQWWSVPWYEGSGWWRNQPDSTPRQPFA